MAINIVPCFILENGFLYSILAANFSRFYLLMILLWFIFSW